VIDRRILANYRVDPEVMGQLLPAPFRPRLHNGQALAGICLIRLREIRPRALPSFIGISSENAAHRVAVEWDTPEGAREGVFIPRRDTNSRLNTLLGGRVFPGAHHHAEFECAEESGRYEVSMRSDDGTAHLRVKGHVVDVLPQDSVFQSLGDASGFFEAGSLGYSTTASPNASDGLELRSFGWKVEPLAIDRVESSFFEDRSKFPDGSARFDCALLMRNIDHEWHARESLCCKAEPA
jgi:hypothetical protein